MGKKHLVFAGISVLCPIFAVIAVSIYQWYANAEFWQTLTPEESFVGAMMAVGELIQLAQSLVIGCVVEIVFAALSLFQRNRFVSVGLAALIFNVIPLLLLAILILRA